jgi:hypothetical protein
MKVVINGCYGGFGLSDEAKEWINENGGMDTKYDYEAPDKYRSNAVLVKCVETLGEKANGSFAELKIVEVPDYIDWVINEYDGLESVEEKHQSWR